MPAGGSFRLCGQTREHRTVVVAGADVVAAMNGSAKANILMVDDQPARLLTYRAILEPLGHNLVAVNSGLEALDALMKQEFAVVLLDVKMPGMDGFETAEL